MTDLTCWEDIVYQFERLPYREIVQAIREVHPEYDDGRLERVTAWLYTEGAFVRRMQHNLPAAYSVELTETSLTLYDGMGEVMAQGSCRASFLDGVRMEMGNRFMRSAKLDAD